MVVVLPVPLTPTTRMTCGLCVAVDRRAAWRRAPARARPPRRAPRARRRREMPFSKRPLRSAVVMRVGRLDAEIGLDQQILEILERLGVELALGEEAGDAVGRASPRSWPRPGLSRWNQPCLMRRSAAAPRSAGAGVCGASSRDGTSAGRRAASGVGSSPLRQSRAEQAPEILRWLVGHAHTAQTSPSQPPAVVTR